MQLAQAEDDFAELGVGLAAITYDDRQVLAAFRTEHDLGYPLLQDLDALHVNRYGVRNEQYPPGDANYGLPHPGMLWIGRDGTIRAKWAVPGYRERPPIEAVVESIRAALEAPSEASGQ